MTFPSPEENLACDEALLDLCDQGKAGECLRFWESKTYFVVVGYSNKISREVNIDSCGSDNIPILRRISGGGTVLQGPGCLNYSLILRITDRPELASPVTTNQYIMERHRLALESLLKTPVTIQGDTDLAILDFRLKIADCGNMIDPQIINHQSKIKNLLKVSGNAQRRFKNALLFHGTFLLDFDLSLVSKYLTLPSKEPAYRKNRAHQDFVSNLSLTKKEIQSHLQLLWKANEENDLSPEVKKLAGHFVQTKYSLDSWNAKFE